LELAERLLRKMVEVRVVKDGALLLEAEPALAPAIEIVLVDKNLRVTGLRHAGGLDLRHP
jgi:hypothetical protein